jgi:hypothetical protein
MATKARCSRCDELWRSYASATLDHLRALKDKEQAADRDVFRLWTLEMKVEALGAERAAARVKITTHLALSHSHQGLSSLTATASR